MDPIIKASALIEALPYLEAFRGNGVNAHGFTWLLNGEL